MVQPSPWRPSFDFWLVRSPRYLVANILAGECQPSGWQRAGNEALIKIRERSELIIFGFARRRFRARACARL